MPRRIASVAAASLLAAGLVAAVPQTATAAPTDAPSTGISPQILGAMERDLGLTASEAKARLAADDRAARTEKSMRDSLGTSFAGTWLDASSGTVHVAVTDQAAAAKVRAAGATPKLVARSQASLTTIKNKLDAGATRAVESITGWYVDVKTNTVVVKARPEGAAAAKTFAAGVGAPSGVVRVEITQEKPTTFHDVVGGDAYYMGGRCSVGFAVSGGFVTAGHCGTPGTATQGHNQVSQGTFEGSSFPGNDYAWVSTNTDWTPTGAVNDYAGGTVAVSGSTESAVGSSVCRSGSTTGWHCGTIQAKDQTVNYAEGAVSGMTQTNACAEPGDSGGSWLTGSQAQGVTSGGSGNCSSGGTTFFQPVNEILSTYGLSLVTS
jgi:streptogrisin C